VGGVPLGPMGSSRVPGAEQNPWEIATWSPLVRQVKADESWSLHGVKRGPMECLATGAGGDGIEVRRVNGKAAQIMRRCSTLCPRNTTSRFRLCSPIWGGPRRWVKAKPWRTIRLCLG